MEKLRSAAQLVFYTGASDLDCQEKITVGHCPPPHLRLPNLMWGYVVEINILAAKENYRF